ncbi:hypothetical protein [Nocardia sp. NPDC059239]|uniref:hypothetical protein n=1 Tax=unclassified Nocardia TaxID=2637762 RepID=UPI0036ACA6D6
MSDHSAVDEIVGEARKFSAAMMAAMKRHTQATGWLERRKARKEISRLLRAEQREQAQARIDNLTWTSQAVDRYRAHSAAVAHRAADPSVDHDRRARDARDLAQHRDDMAAQFIGNDHLTRTEQGIALDGLDAATMFPEYETGNLFSRAHKVKGIEALRYRARVARETATVRERAEAERAGFDVSLDAARRANREQRELTRIEKAQPDQSRYVAEMIWTSSRGEIGMSDVTALPTEHAATAWMARSVDSSLWTEGTTLAVRITDRDGAATQYSESGRPEIVADQLDAREAMLRERTLAGQVHRDPPAQARETGARDSGRFNSFLTYWPEGGNGVQNVHARHDSEIAAVAWTENQLNEIRSKADSVVLVSAFEHDGNGHHEPVFQAEGGRQFLVDEVAQWREGAERDAGRQRGEPPRESAAAERDRLRGELDSLTTRHRLSIEHNGDLTDQNAALTRQMALLTTERDHLLGQRDSLRGERDEAVQKLAERTPAHERFGSPERQAEQAKAAARQPGRSALADYQHGQTLADAVARNGHDREGMER